MERNFISLRDAAEGLAEGNDSEVEMYLSLLITDAEDGRLSCIKSWTEGRDRLLGGISFMREPGEWRVLRTALKTWMDVRAIHQASGHRETDNKTQPAEQENTATRNRRRYQMCIDAGLDMPDNDYATLPVGVAQLADKEGISRQGFSKSVKAHIATLPR